MTQKYIELNLNDEKAGKVAEVLNNKTAKKILGLLAEEELSQGDISKKLKIGLNNVDYTMKKLIDSGLVEKTSSFFWSVKGKKIPTYRLANKKIIISTKNSFKSLVLSGVLGGLILGGTKLWTNYNSFNTPRAYSENLPLNDVATYAASPLMAKSADLSSPVLFQTTSIFNDVLIYILMGLAIGVLGYFIFKKVKQIMKGGKNKI